jgi:hypothetical protein
MEGPKRFVPSPIRLKRFDGVTFGAGESLYEFTAGIIASQKLGLAGGNGKVDLPRIEYVVTPGQRGREHIEAASDGIDVSPDLGAKCERELAFFSRYYPIVRGWQWRLFDADMDVEIEPSVQPSLQGWQLGFGPVNAGLCG